MRYAYTLAAAFVGLAAAGYGSGACAQTVADPDAPYLLNGGVTIEQRGCVASPKVYGSESFELDGYRYGGCLPRGTDKNLDAFRVLLRAAEAVGQYRNNCYAFTRDCSDYLVVGDTTANWRLQGNGTWNGEQVGIRLDMDYRIPALRLSVTHADKKQDVTVVSDPRKPAVGRTGHLEQPEIFGDGPLEGVVLAAWTEKPAGVYSGPATVAPEELMVIPYLLPSGVILAGRNAADKIKLSRVGRNDVLTIPVAALGGANLVARLDATSTPVHTEIVLKGKTYTGDFSDFLNDRMDTETKAPHTIKIQLDGKPLADWQLDYHHMGPYLLFPVPAQVAAKK